MATRTHTPLAALPAVRRCLCASRWLHAHAHCFLLLLLLLAASVHVVTATTASDATRTAAASAAAAASAPLQPHVLLLSLPWRGHMMPLLHLGTRLAARGFHVSMGAATEEARDLIAAHAAASGQSIDAVPAGNFQACARVKRARERQPRFDAMDAYWNATQQATLHPGAQLTDLFAPPAFAFQAIETTNSSGPTGAPNGISLLMRTYADFQACMGPTLATTLAELNDPARYESRWKDAQTLQKKEKQQFRNRERQLEKAAAANATGSAAKKKKEKDAREAARLERESALFPSLLRVDVPRLVIVDRFSFAGMDAAKLFNITYIVNNPSVLLDLDSPSWSLPAPWSYLPPRPPLSLSSRLSNLLHRFNYRATMLRSFALVNANRALQGLSPLSSWSDYFDGALVLTNTVWGVELHRSADAQGMHAHRNANPAAHAHTPRFRMTGPLLPVSNSTTSFALYSPPMGVSALGGRLASVASMTLPQYAESLFDARLVRFMNRVDADRGSERRRVVYVNLGDGDEITRADLDALFTGLQPLSKRIGVVLSLPKRSIKSLIPSGTEWPSFVHHVSWLPQFEFLAHYSQLHQLALVISHASMGNVQEALAAGLPLLLLPHPTVDQMDVAARFARTNAVRILQRVQLNSDSIRNSTARILDDPTYALHAQHLSSLFAPSSSQGTPAAVSLVELAYRVGWQHLLPSTANPAAPLPWYRHAVYGLPLDVLALFALLIAILVWASRQMWAVACAIWNGDKRLH